MCVKKKQSFKTKKNIENETTPFFLESPKTVRKLNNKVVYIFFNIFIEKNTHTYK
jgi:hypothetical protein